MLLLGEFTLRVAGRTHPLHLKSAPTSNALRSRRVLVLLWELALWGEKAAARAAQSGTHQGQQAVEPPDRTTHLGEPVSQPFAAKRLSL